MRGIDVSGGSSVRAPWGRHTGPRGASRSSAAPEVPPKTRSATEDAFLPATPGRADARHRPHRSLCRAGAARRIIVRGAGRLPERYQRPSRCPSTASSMPPSAPALGRAVHRGVEGPHPRVRGASVVGRLQQPWAAGRRTGWRRGRRQRRPRTPRRFPQRRGRQGQAWPPTCGTVRRFHFLGVNNIVTPSKASRLPRDQGRKPSERVHFAGPSAPPAPPENQYPVPAYPGGLSRLITPASAPRPRCPAGGAG